MSRHDGPDAASVELIRTLTERGLTIATAESLTGGLLAAALVDVPGASIAFNGGIVAYATPLKRTLLGVAEELLAERGAVDPDVARQMADRVRLVCAVDGRPADVGVATTGVAGPDPQDGRSPGTVFVGVAMGDHVEVTALELTGDRAAIRSATVHAAIGAVRARLAHDGRGT
ncbi:CinA family protein [Agromyces ramosus]|uniref:Nicotinamide-nucleotide amidase n=1 Tax=Agromyces ramosus TaxID=33879 RepID=A0ABU0RCC4_9MICO|nr:CinA family protein [Agromyces ramosus]MDQ0895708.1 nicotinamide-nucleotide amidase [Agromyces ramosus]